MYNFRDQDAIGQFGAELLDGYCSQLWSLRPATMAEELRGIDRIATRPDGLEFWIEYKTDVVADKTGNVFVEIVADDVARRPGWAYTSQAHLLLYFLPYSNRVLAFHLAQLRRLLPQYEQRFRQARTPNRGYHTIGLLVPITVIVRDKAATLIDFSRSAHPYCLNVQKRVKDNLNYAVPPISKSSTHPTPRSLPQRPQRSRPVQPAP